MPDTNLHHSQVSAKTFSNQQLSSSSFRQSPTLATNSAFERGKTGGQPLAWDKRKLKRFDLDKGQVPIHYLKLLSTPAQNEKPPVCSMQTKAALIQPIFPKGTEPIPLSLKHRKIKQFQYTLSPLKSIGKTLSGAGDSDV